MKQILNKLFRQQYLTENEAKGILGDISEGKYNPYEIRAVLTDCKMRNIPVVEVKGFRNCLQERCIPIGLDEFDAVDLCGTGCDGKDTFNVTTLASFIVAGAGYNLAKHG